MPTGKRDTATVIAEVARREFAEFGFAGARVARIAARAGVNKQLLFYYFRSKAGLYQAVIQRVRDEIGLSFEPRTTRTNPAEQLRIAVVRLFDLLTERPSLVRLLIQETAQPDRTIPLMVDEIRTIISQGQGLGFFRDDMDPDVAARQALVLTLGYLGLEPALGINEKAARPAWRDATADLLIRAISW